MTHVPACMRGLAAVAFVTVLAACSTTMDRTELAAEYYNLGTAFFDLGDLERSADYFSRAIELDGSLARASYNLARVYTVQGRFDEASEILQGLRTQDPSNTIVLETIGFVAYSQGESENARSAYGEVLSIDPGNLNALFNLAKIEDEGGNHERSVELLRSARELAPSDPGVLELLATLEERIGNTDAAVSALESLRSTDGATTDSLLFLANLYETQERYDKALETLDVVIDIGPESEGTSEANFRKARILLTAAEETEAGLEALEAAIASGFADAEAIADLLDHPDLTVRTDVEEILASYGLSTDPSADSGDVDSPPVEPSAGEVTDDTQE